MNTVFFTGFTVYDAYADKYLQYTYDTAFSWEDEAKMVLLQCVDEKRGPVFDPQFFYEMVTFIVDQLGTDGDLVRDCFSTLRLVYVEEFHSNPEGELNYQHSRTDVYHLKAYPIVQFMKNNDLCPYMVNNIDLFT
jgi:hypothetical protein